MLLGLSVYKRSLLFINLEPEAYWHSSDGGQSNVIEIHVLLMVVVFYFSAFNLTCVPKFGSEHVRTS